jgi:two-component system sensor histidine kinase TctE
MQLLVLARADGGSPAVSDGEPTDLREVITDVIDEHLPQAAKARVSLRFSPPASPCLARVDVTLVAEILKNVIDNAVTYNDVGGSVVVGLAESDGRVVIEVEDDGPGVPDSELANVFLRFYRLKRDSNRPGSGLGLAIVQALAAKLKAEVEAGPGQGGRGLCLRIALPRAATGSGCGPARRPQDFVVDGLEGVVVGLKRRAGGQADDQILLRLQDNMIAGPA